MIGWGFCDIHNNQSRGRGFQLKLKAEADNPYWDYSGYHKKLILMIVFVIHWMKKMVTTVVVLLLHWQHANLT